MSRPTQTVGVTATGTSAALRATWLTDAGSAEQLQTTVRIATLTAISGASIAMLSISQPTGVIETAARVIHSLLDVRDFLGLQLAQAEGMVSDDQFEREAEAYLKRKDWEDEALAANVAALVMLIGERADADVVSTVFNCGVAQAERAMANAAEQLVYGHRARGHLNG